jgi:formate hydrogenlyase transcriptional activator
MLGNSLTRLERGSDANETDIVGTSQKLRRVLDLTNIVGPTDATVVICGESGTGKELVAKRIHALSARHKAAFVEINCAAIPLGLLESELFGHEKGAFTGAIAQRIGRFEVAHQGTLFLDEIGDIPPELQPKLLRVLQEQQFERLGGTRTIRTNVRLIAATHRNLQQMVDEGVFRADLYYRLNVFPITLPPLRERREDIAELVWSFTEKFARKLGKQIDVIPAEVMDRLVTHGWTGNIRELQNFIERAVILSRSHVLEPPLADLTPLRVDPAPITLRDAERAHITRILKEVDGVIATAATRLAVPRSTLFYKMRRLGIHQPRPTRLEQAIGKRRRPALVREDAAK